MKKENNCNIVQDLLPSYIENLTSEETNLFIKEHLKTCKRCKDIYNNMTENIENDLINEEIDIFKKIYFRMRFFRILILSISIILIIFLLTTINKLIVLNKIDKVLHENDFSNFYCERTETGEEYTKKTECYKYFDNYIVLETEINNKTNEINRKVYNNEINKIEEIKNYNNINKLEIAIKLNSIEEVKLYNKDCFLIKDNDEIKYIDKNTGIILKEINIKDNVYIDYNYSFGNMNNEKIDQLKNL